MSVQTVRANGGYLYHSKPAGANRALCGHEPRDTARKMRTRGGWMLRRDDAPPMRIESRCRKCERIVPLFSGGKTP